MKRKLASIVSTVVIGGLLLTGGGVGFADNATANTPSGQKPGAGQFGGINPGRMGGDMQSPMNQGGIENGQDMMKKLTESLVEEGIITQAIADKMIAFHEEKDAERKAEMEKVKSMTEEERKAYFESKKDTKPEGKHDPMAEMVETGILTQVEADAISAYQKEQAETKMKEAQEKRQEEIETQLDSLVDAGTITEDQADTILAYLEQEKENRKAEMDKLKDMTEEERKAYFENKKGTKPEEGSAAGPMQELIEDGTLTQAQADAVAKVLYPQPPQGGQPGGSGTKASNN